MALVYPTQIALKEKSILYKLGGCVSVAINAAVCSGCCVLPSLRPLRATVLSVDQIRALCGADHVVWGVVVRHLGARGVAVSGAAHRAAGGVAGVAEPAEVLCVDRLVALQDSDGFIHFEPLPLPPCDNKGQVVGMWLWFFLLCLF